MAKKQPVSESLRTVLTSSERWRVKKSIRQLIEHLQALDASTRADTTRSIISFMDAFTPARATIDRGTVVRNARDLEDALSEFALGTNDVRYICTHFVPDARDLQTRSQQGFQSHLGLRFMRYVGDSLQRTLRFCRLIFTERSRVIEAMQRRGESAPVDEGAELLVTKMSLLIPVAMCAPVTGWEAYKNWLLRLVEGTLERNREAEAYLSAATQWAMTNAEAESFPVIDDTEYRRMYGTASSEQLAVKLDAPHLVLPDELATGMDRITRRDIRRRERDQRRSAEIFSIMRSQRKAIAQAFDRRCREIREKPRYGLRPMGYDSLLTRITPLRAAGITSFSYYPEGETFPNAKIAVTVNKDGSPILCQYWVALRDFELTSTGDLFENWIGLDTGHLHLLLTYIIVDVLHRIVVVGRMRDLEKNEVQRRELDAFTEPKHQVKVRPFIRRLPIGQQASDEARQLAFLELGWELPDGVTFVQSHDRWTGLPAGKPAPLMIYTDGEFRRSISPK